MKKTIVLLLVLCAVVLADSTVVDIFNVTYIQHGIPIDDGNAYTEKELDAKLQKLEFINIDIDSVWIWYHQKVYWRDPDSMVVYLLDIQNMNPVADTLGEQWFDRETWGDWMADEQPRYSPVEGF